MKDNKARLLIFFGWNFFFNLKTYQYLQLTVKKFVKFSLKRS